VAPNEAVREVQRHTSEFTSLTACDVDRSANRHRILEL